MLFVSRVGPDVSQGPSQEFAQRPLRETAFGAASSFASAVGSSRGALLQGPIGSHLSGHLLVKESLQQFRPTEGLLLNSPLELSS
jgi:hypothetical protein